MRVERALRALRRWIQLDTDPLVEGTTKLLVAKHLNNSSHGAFQG